MQNFQGRNRSKNWYKTGKNFSKNWYKYTKEKYLLDKVTNGLKIELNELPSQYKRFTYPSSSKENAVISAEIMKLVKKKLLSIAHQSIMNSFLIFLPQ